MARRRERCTEKSGNLLDGCLCRHWLGCRVRIEVIGPERLATTPAIAVDLSGQCHDARSDVPIVASPSVRHLDQLAEGERSWVDSDDASDWVLLSAYAISDNGWIAGEGFFGDDKTNKRAFLIDARTELGVAVVPEPAALLGGLALFSLVAARRRVG